MGYELRGHTILSQGEFVELMRSAREGSPAPPALVAWFSGERVAPESLQLAFQKMAVYVDDDRGHEILARAVHRINEALGRPELCFDPMPAAEPGELEIGL